MDAAESQPNTEIIDNEVAPALDSDEDADPIDDNKTPVPFESRTRRALKSLRRRFPFYLIGAEAIIFLLTRLPNIKELPIHVDESLYIGWANAALHGAPWYSMIDGKGPLHAWSMGPFLKVFSDPLRAGRMNSVFWGAIALVAIILIGKALKSWTLGAFAGLFWVLCPFILFYDKTAFIEGMILSLMVVTVFFAVKAARTGRIVYFVLTGVALGAALWTKGTAQLLFLVIPLAYLTREPATKKEPEGEESNVSTAKRKRPLLRWLVSAGLSLLLGYGLFSLLRFSPNYSQMAARSTVMSRTIPQILKDPFTGLGTNLHGMWNALWSQATPIVLLICVIGLLAGIVFKWRPVWFLWAWLLVSVTATALSARHPFDRYWTILLPPLILGAGYAATELAPRAYKWMSKLKEVRLRKGLEVAVIVVSALLFIGAVYIPARNEIRFVKDPGKGLTQASWGYKVNEVVELLRTRSQNQPVRVEILSRYTFYMLRAYGIPNVIYENLGAKPKPGQEGFPVYVVGSGLNGKPKGLRLSDVHVYSRDGTMNRITLFARIK